MNYPCILGEMHLSVSSSPHWRASCRVIKDTGFEPCCLVQIRAVQSWMSYLTSPGLCCLNCKIGMMIALTYQVGGLNESDQCLACSDHSVYVSSCYYGCYEHSVSSQMCGAIWGNERCDSCVAVH